WPDALSLKWKVEVGPGYATPIVIGNRVFAFSRNDGKEVMRALDAATGRVIWESDYPAPYTTKTGTWYHGDGPKATPTYAGGRLFTFGISGIVAAFDAATGKILWRTAPPAIDPLYGTGMSPIVDGDVVIVHVGGHDHGALTAFDTATGATKWAWTGDGPAY